MTKFTYEQANRMYTVRYTHTDIENGVPVLYEPVSVATNAEMDAIFKVSKTWVEVLTAMHALHGTPGPKFARSQIKRR